jgi:predicted metalloprotease with PDZ domain
MLHLGVPSMPRRHLWLTEGLATYVEPLARARRGELSAEEVWRGMVRGIPHGLPRTGDRGLDRTPSWGRIYWGGALFALLADLEIRERTQGKRGLDHALRAVVERGGHNGVWWTIERFLEVGDEATGTRVLRELYDRMATAPHEVDLDALWRRLGVIGRGPSLHFDDRAPLADVRRALTAPGGA